MLSLPLSTRCIRPWTAAAQKLPKVTRSTTSHMGSAGSETTRAAAATRDAPAKVGVYAGGKEMPFTSVLRIEDPDKLPVWPVFRVLDDDGSVRADAVEPKLGKETALKMYGNMVRLEAMDDIFYNAQRQGRISFYLQSAGEEALQMGGAAALDMNDMAFTQYREPGLLMWRDFGIQSFADQCLSNISDLGKGRQMPVHYGSKELHYQTVSSPLGTQIPQAVGAGYALKLSGKDNIAVCYFGDGAASEGDFHAALALAATRDVPVLFVCRNNGYAISTSVADQYRGDGIVSRAPGYGMHAVRVDGNDALAMFAATAEARRICLSQKKPVLMEAMTYRLGHHSTSDDWSRYRSSNEVKQWKANHHPIRRFCSYLEGKGWWDSAKDRILRDRERRSVLIALETAERKAKPSLGSMFEDVYEVAPPHLQEQKHQLHAHLERNAGRYDGAGG
ncbi:unnamed protein product [Ectocarpus sp. 8 AP-2014]